jgi:hypothetical protein
MGSLGVRVTASGYCQLYHTRRGCYATFCPNSQYAIINGDEVHVTLKSGSVAIYRINSNQTGVTGPVRVFPA